jgi:hexulose-6-phosphate isomerase
MDHCMRVARQFDFDGIEVTMEDPAPLLPEALSSATDDILAIGRSVGMTTERPGGLSVSSTDAEIRDVARLAAQAGIRVHSLATMMLFFYPLSSPIPAVRDRGIHIVRRMIHAGAILGADTILIYPGMVTPSVGYGEVYRRSQAVLRDIEVEARREGVVLALENVWNRFLQSPLEMARYIDELQSPYIGVYFDVANVLRLGYPEDWLRILGPRVKGIHFKDFRRDVDNIRGFTHLLHGDVDWPAVAGALREIGYAGFVTVEVPPLQTYPQKGIADARSSLDRILATRAD